MDIESFKNEALVNDIGFIYLDKEYSIIMDNNSYIAVDSDDNVTNFNKYNDVYKDLEDLLNNWIIEGKPLKEIVGNIKLL